MSMLVRNLPRDARQCQDRRLTDSLAFASVWRGCVKQSFLLLSWSIEYEVINRKEEVPFAIQIFPRLSKGSPHALGPGLSGPGPAPAPKAAVTLQKSMVVATGFYYHSCSAVTRAPRQGQMSVIWSFTAHSCLVRLGTTED